MSNLTLITLTSTTPTTINFDNVTFFREVGNTEGEVCGCQIWFVDNTYITVSETMQQIKDQINYVNNINTKLAL